MTPITISIIMDTVTIITWLAIRDDQVFLFLLFALLLLCLCLLFIKQSPWNPSRTLSFFAIITLIIWNVRRDDQDTYWCLVIVLQPGYYCIWFVSQYTYSSFEFALEIGVASCGLPCKSNTCSFVCFVNSMLFFSVCFGNSILYCWFALRTKQYHCATRHLGAPAVGHFVGHFRGSIVGHRVGHFYVRLLPLP